MLEIPDPVLLGPADEVNHQLHRDRSGGLLDLNSEEQSVGLTLSIDLVSVLTRAVVVRSVGD